MQNNLLYLIKNLQLISLLLLNLDIYKILVNLIINLSYSTHFQVMERIVTLLKG